MLADEKKKDLYQLCADENPKSCQKRWRTGMDDQKEREREREGEREKFKELRALNVG